MFKECPLSPCTHECFHGPAVVGVLQFLLLVLHFMTQKQMCEGNSISNCHGIWLLDMQAHVGKILKTR